MSGKQKTVSVRLDPELMEQIRQIAGDTPVSEWVRSKVMAEVNRRKPTRPRVDWPPFPHRCPYGAETALILIAEGRTPCLICTKIHMQVINNRTRGMAPQWHSEVDGHGYDKMSPMQFAIWVMRDQPPTQRQ